MRHVVRNVSSLYVVRGLGVLTAIGLFPYIASKVTLTEFGIWLLIGSISFFVATSDFGMGTSVVRYVSDALARGDEEEANQVIVSSAGFFAVLAVGAATVVFVLFTVGFDLFAIPEAEWKTTLAAVSIAAVVGLLIGVPLTVFRQVLVGLHRMDLGNGALLVQILARLILIVVALETGLGILGVVAADATAGVIASSLALVLCRRQLPGLRLRRRYMRLDTLRAMAAYSLNVFAMGLASMALRQGGVVVIGLVRPVAAVTLYAAGSRLFQVCREITAAVLQAIVPEASRAAAIGDHETTRRLLLRGSSFANAVVIALAVPAIVLAEPLLVLWVGEDFLPAVPVAQLLLVGMLIGSIHVVGTGLLIGMGRVRRIARYEVIWAVSGLALALVLTPLVGLEGAALGIGLPLLVLEPLYVRATCGAAGVRVRTFLRHAVLIPYGTAALPAIAVGAAAVLWSPSGAGAIVALSTFFVVTFAAGMARFGLDEDERRFIAGLMRRGGPDGEPEASPPPSPGALPAPAPAEAGPRP